MIAFGEDELYKSKIQVIRQNIVPDCFDDKDLPNDLHFVWYSVSNKTFVDAVRGLTSVSIFDVYYDKLKDQFGDSCPHRIIRIENGHGLISPRRYGKIGKT